MRFIYLFFSLFIFIFFPFYGFCILFLLHRSLTFSFSNLTSLLFPFSFSFLLCHSSWFSFHFFSLSFIIIYWIIFLFISCVLIGFAFPLVSSYLTTLPPFCFFLLSIFLYNYLLFYHPLYLLCPQWFSFSFPFLSSHGSFSLLAFLSLPLFCPFIIIYFIIFLYIVCVLFISRLPLPSRSIFPSLSLSFSSVPFPQRSLRHFPLEQTCFLLFFSPIPKTFLPRTLLLLSPFFPPQSRWDWFFSPHLVFLNTILFLIYVTRNFFPVPQTFSSFLEPESHCYLLPRTFFSALYVSIPHPFLPKFPIILFFDPPILLFFFYLKITHLFSFFFPEL